MNFVDLTTYFLFFLFGFFANKTIRRFIKRSTQWSIGIYEGKSPFVLAQPKKVNNPVLSAKNINDVEAEFVADPFMLLKDGMWYMFFEVMNKKNKKGEIALATSKDGYNWKYEKVVLKEPFHLSYPYVFSWDNEYYMVPETFQTKSVRLYKAVKFPHKWTFVNTLIEGHPFIDATVVFFNGKWWLFTTLPRNNILLLYYSESLSGEWKSHPQNPIIMGDPSISRPGGRPIIYNNRLFRFTQDGSSRYGSQVRAFEIITITPETYEEALYDLNPIIKASGSGWNKLGMHNVDVHQIEENKWIACVDGEGEYINFSLQF